MSTDLHNRVARTYNSETGVIAAKNRMVLRRQKCRWASRSDPLAVVDLGVGDGALLAALSGALAGSAGPPLTLTGVDISPAMLARAVQRVPLTPILSCASRAGEHVPAGAFDLVLAHFILAYVDRRTLLRQARRLLAPGGVVSVATSTNEGAAPLLEQIEAGFRFSRNPLRRAVATASDRAFARSCVPDDGKALLADAAACGLRLLSRDTLRQSITFQTAKDAYQFAIEDGWCVNVLALPGVPVPVAQAIARAALGMFRYPFTFTQVVEMMEFAAADSPASTGTEGEAARMSVSLQG